jgi:LEA14-like dessication related protein
LEYRKLTDIKFETFTFSKIVLKTNLQLYNPNSIGVDVVDSDMDIYINDKLIGKSKQVQPTRVNRISEFALPIEVEVETAQLDLSYLKDLWEKSQKGKVKVSVKGICKLRKMAVPIKLPIDYTDDVDLKLPSLF